MNTSSYSPIASGTYNHWKVEFCFKNKNDQNINTMQAMLELYTMWLGGSNFSIHSRSLLFEGNASLKCVYSGLTLLSTVFQSYHDGVWLLQGAQCGLVVPIFIHIIREFPVLLFAFLLC